MQILECSSKGDKRFSAFYAKIELIGVVDSIEMHYQLAKGFNEIERANRKGTWKEKNEYLKSVKGKKPDFFWVGSKKVDVNYLTPYYKLLWVKYFDANPDLVTHAKTFDEYNDIFKGKSINCQADVIRQYMKEGRRSIINECQEFIALLKQ